MVDIMRPGPGDGEIMASQSDYTQVTRGGGHGDYRTIVYVEDADVVLVVWDSFARVCISAVKKAREEGLKVGLIRPITLWPFPNKIFEELNGRKFLVCELNAGQMVDDVRLAVENKHDVYLYHRFGCTLPSPKEILAEIHDLIHDLEVKK